MFWCILSAIFIITLVGGLGPLKSDPATKSYNFGVEHAYTE